MGWGERARKASVSCNKYLYQLLVLRDLNKVKANNHHNFMSRMIAFDTLTSTDNLEGTDKTTLHAYGPIYDELFHPRKDQVRNVLEIGVLSGASLVNLANFFPQANILGIDIDLKNVRYGMDNPRVTMIECDATKVEDFTLSLITLAGFDIIIDDGSHAPEDMVASFSSADYLHGPISSLTQNSRVILLSPGNSADESISATVKKTREITNNIYWIGTGFKKGGNEVLIGGSTGLSEAESVIADAVVLQQFAMLLAIKNGLNPDAPIGLLKVTQTI